MIKYFIIIYIFVAFSSYMVNSQKDEGDACTTSNNEMGVCKNFKMCPKELQRMRNRIFPMICSYQGRETIVCCPEDRPINTPPTTQSIPTYKSLVIEECAFPKNAIKVERKNQKAWDKCIDLADNIWPCRRLGLMKERQDTCKHKVKQLILGGTAANDNEFPHMASLGYEGAEGIVLWDCGGTLISEQWILTAAHCTWNRNTQSDVKHVRLGGGDMRIQPDPKFVFEVAQIVRHPNYSGLKIYNDIALLKLNREVKYSYEMRPACLHTGDNVNDDKIIAIGYGATEDSRKRSNALLKVILNKYPNSYCTEKYVGLKKSPDGIREETQMCYGSNETDKDTCQGDSGSPIQIYNTNVHCTYNVIGLTSMGKSCGVAGLPGVYTRVSAYIPWIESIVWP